MEKQTTDPMSGKKIRKTKNGLREKDVQVDDEFQSPRRLTEEEASKLLGYAIGGDI